MKNWLLVFKFNLAVIVFGEHYTLITEMGCKNSKDAIEDVYTKVGNPAASPGRVNAEHAL